MARRGGARERISSTLYFPRYFQYSIPFDDVADLPLDAFIGQISAMLPVQAAGELRAFWRTNPERLILVKLATKQEGLSQEASIILVRALAMVGHELSRLEDSNYRSPQFIARGIIFSFLRKLDTQSGPDELAETVIKDAATLGHKLFLWQIFETTPQDEQQHGRLLSIECEDNIRNALAIALREAFQHKPFHEQIERHDALRHYVVWANSTVPNEAAQYLVEYFVEISTRTGSFLVNLVPVACSSEDPRGLPGHVMLDGYYKPLRELIITRNNSLPFSSKPLARNSSPNLSYRLK